MHNVYDLIASKYGNDVFFAITALDGSVDTILAPYDTADLSDPVLVTMASFCGMSPAEYTARDAYNTCIKVLIDLWISHLDRQQVLILVNALNLVENTRISLCDGVSLSAYDIVYEYNSRKPDSKIFVNPDYL